MTVDAKAKPSVAPTFAKAAAAALPAVRKLVQPLPVGEPEADRRPPDRSAVLAEPRTSARFPWRFASFAALVLAPVFAATIYFAFVASDQFASDIRFAVRGATQRLPGADALATSGVGALAGMNTFQDSYLVASTIESGAIIPALRDSVDLGRVFGAPEADWWSRMKAGLSREEGVRYWRNMVRVSVEAVSGIVSVEVRAFRPGDAVALAQAIRDRSETVADQLLAPARAELVARAQAGVTEASARLAAIRGRMEELRNRQGMINPLLQARSLMETAAALKRSLIALDVELQSAAASAGANSPMVKALEARRPGLEEQIAAVEARITAADADPAAASALLADYDRLDAERTLAEHALVTAEKVLEEARRDAERRHVYLEVIEGPTAPQSARYPERAGSIAVTAAACLTLWALLALGVAGIRDHAS